MTTKLEQQIDKEVAYIIRRYGFPIEYTEEALNSTWYKIAHTLAKKLVRKKQAFDKLKKLTKTN